jgi:hypothetical protein
VGVWAASAPLDDSATVLQQATGAF